MQFIGLRFDYFFEIVIAVALCMSTNPFPGFVDYPIRVYVQMFGKVSVGVEFFFHVTVA